MTEPTASPVCLTLHVAGQTPKSLAAIHNLERICDAHDAARFEVEG